MRLKRIFESRDVTINDSVHFSFYVDTDPMRARFMAKTAKDLDKLNSDQSVKKAIMEIEEKLAQATGVKWSYDESDPGAGYSFILDEQALAKKIESSFSN